MKNQIIIVAIGALIMGGGVGFWGGMKYQENKQPAFSRQFTGGQNWQQHKNVNNGTTTGNRGSFRPVAGEIISVDGDSITVKMNDGSSKIVLLTDKTEVNKAETVSKDELKTGETVSVFGSENSDGSVSANNIQLNPDFANMPGEVTPTN